MAKLNLDEKRRSLEFVYHGEDRKCSFPSVAIWEREIQPRLKMLMNAKDEERFRHSKELLPHLLPCFKAEEIEGMTLTEITSLFDHVNSELEAVAPKALSQSLKTDGK